MASQILCISTTLNKSQNKFISDMPGLSRTFFCDTIASMKLKHRLYISFFIIVIMPIALYGLVVFDGFRTGEMLGIPENANANEARQAVMDLVISGLIILTITSLLLVAWIYQGVVSKIDTLITAADEIREGNLDNPIMMTGKDEIAEVGVAFESMRLRLKEDAQERLIAERTQRNLLSNVAHDLKTPLTAIRGYSEGLMDGVANTDEKRLSYITTIHNKAEEMDALLNELTAYSKLETNQIPYNFQRLDVNVFFSDLVKILILDLDNQNAELVYKSDVEPGTLFVADPLQIERAVNNVIGNSIKYRSELPLRIEFNILDEDKDIRVEISDNGIGIEGRDLPRIFERLYRGDEARSSAGGNGIGLSIVKKIIVDHGGMVGATSKPSEGTTIYWQLHKYLPPEEERSEQDTDRRRRRSNRRTGKGLS